MNSSVCTTVVFSLSMVLSVKRVTDIAGAWCCQLVAGRTDLMYVGVYNGIYLVGKKNGEWQVVGKIEGVNDSCVFLSRKAIR